LTNEQVEKLEKIVEERDKQIKELKAAIEQLKSYTPEASNNIASFHWQLSTSINLKDFQRAL